MTPSADNRWFFSESANTNLAAINKKLKSQALERCVSELNRNYRDYQPWMSSTYDRDSFSRLGKIHIKGAGNPPSIITSPDDLLLIRSAFAMHENGGDIERLSEQDQYRQIMPPNCLQLPIFKREMSKALAFLDENCPVISKSMNDIVEQILPFSPRHAGKPLRTNGSGLTSHSYRGGILLSLANESEISVFENLLNLVHELGHTSFNVYLCCDQIIEDEDVERPLFSVVRKTKRPALLSFHALVASAFMLFFCNESYRSLHKIVNKKYLAERIEGLFKDVDEGAILISGLRLTRFGSVLLGEIMSLLRREEKFSWNVCNE